jgi:tetratricopeptide (TPR) repeat protein
MRLKKRDVLAWCILFYGMSVIITSNLLVDIGATAAERFIFTGSLGFCVAIVWLVAKVLKVNVTTANLNNAKPMMALLGVVALLYAGKTYARNEAWRNNLALYETGLETAPNSWRAQYLLAVEYTKRMQTENDQNTKLDYYRKAVTGFNNSLNILPNNSDVYLLRGYADEFAGQLDSAVYAYKRTLQLDKNNKQAQVNLGGILMRTGRLDEAIEILTKVVAVDSLNTHALTNLGACYGNKGMFKESEVYYLKAVRLEPEQPANVFMSMSNIYKYMGDSANAQKYRAKMMQAKPQ